MCSIDQCTLEIRASRYIQSKELYGHRAQIGGRFAFSRCNKIDESIYEQLILSKE